MILDQVKHSIKSTPKEVLKAEEADDDMQVMPPVLSLHSFIKNQTPQKSAGVARHVCPLLFSSTLNFSVTQAGHTAVAHPLEGVPTVSRLAFVELPWGFSV